MQHTGLQVLDPGREHRRDVRHSVERILDLSRHLPASERVLIEQVYKHHLRLADVAAMLNESNHVVNRRLSHILRRLHHPVFRYVVIHGQLLKPTCRRVAQLHVIQGKSMRDVAAETGLSLHRVRQYITMVRALAHL